MHIHIFLFLTDSAHSFGATIACILAGIAMSTLGRRGATLLCTVPCYLIGYIVIGMSSNYITLILGRFLTGLGLGMTLTIPNVYIVEVTSPVIFLFFNSLFFFKTLNQLNVFIFRNTEVYWESYPICFVSLAYSSHMLWGNGWIGVNWR